MKFLRTIDREVPKGLAVHMILDNYATHKHPDVVALAGQAPALPSALHADLELVAQPRRTLVPGPHRQGHPPRRVRLGPDLITAIEEYLDANNDDPKPFVWTATAEQILEKVRRGRTALDQIAG